MGGGGGLEWGFGRRGKLLRASFPSVPLSSSPPSLPSPSGPRGKKGRGEGRGGEGWSAQQHLLIGASSSSSFSWGSTNCKAHYVRLLPLLFLLLLLLFLLLLPFLLLSLFLLLLLFPLLSLFLLWVVIRPPPSPFLFPLPPTPLYRWYHIGIAEGRKGSRKRWNLLLLFFLCLCVCVCFWT